MRGGKGRRGRGGGREEGKGEERRKMWVEMGKIESGRIGQDKIDILGENNEIRDIQCNAMQQVMYFDTVQFDLLRVCHTMQGRE